MGWQGGCPDDGPEMQQFAELLWGYWAVDGLGISDGINKAREEVVKQHPGWASVFQCCKVRPAGYNGSIAPAFEVRP